MSIPGHDLRRAVSRDRVARHPLRRAVRHRGALDRHLLPAELPRPHAEAGERHVLRDVRRRARGRLPRLQAVPARGRARARREWNLRGDTAGRAMRLIADGVVEREGVPGLAARLGYSPRHLTRLLTAELGAGPLALSRAHRAHTARMLLVGTDLPAADVAFSAGFASVRQFNDTVREVFGMPPLELRARRRARAGRAAERRARRDRPRAAAPRTARRGRALRLDARARGRRRRGRDRRRRSPARCGSPAARPGSSCASTTSAGCGCARGSRTSATCRRSSRARGACSTSTPTRSRSTRRWRGIAELAPLVAAVPGIRVPGAADPHEMLIRAMVGQQITVAAARTALTALTRRARRATSTASTARPQLFPTMAAIAEHGHEVLRGPAARIRALIGAAAALADGIADAHRGRRRRRAARGAARHAGHRAVDRGLRPHARASATPTCSCPGDVAVRAGAAAAGIPSDAAALTAWAARTAPWRVYLTAHLWRAVAPCRNSASAADRGSARAADPAVPRSPAEMTQPSKETSR